MIVEFTREEAMVLRDAVTEAFHALRTLPNGMEMTEEGFLNSPQFTEGRKTRYNTLRTIRESLVEMIR